MALDKKWLWIGGAGILALAGGYYIYSGASGGGGDAAATNSGDLSTMYPTSIYGGGGGTPSTASDGTDQLSQLLAAQVTQSNQNYQLGTATLESNERVSLATLDTQKAIALDTNQAAIEQSLAGQLGSIVQAMQFTRSRKGGAGSKSALGEIAGTIGFADGKISLDLAGTQVWPTLIQNQAAVQAARDRMGTGNTAAAVAAVNPNP